MEPPAASTSSGRSSVMDSLRGCTLSGTRIHKADLRAKITMPQYIRMAIRDAIKEKNVEAGIRGFNDLSEKREEKDAKEVLLPPESPMVVFINSKSGGRHGPELKARLEELMGQEQAVEIRELVLDTVCRSMVVFINSESGGRHGPELKARLEELMGQEQVFELQSVKPHEFILHGLGCLEKLAELGDSCAKACREKLRVVVAGGDGTVGWVLGCLGELHKQGREPVPPTAIIPLGTGNDLSRSFGWGGSFPFNWKSAIKRILEKARSAEISRLDSWKISITMPLGEIHEPPHCLKALENRSDQDAEVLADLPEKVSFYEGVFYNYFSIGMDAQVAYGFHHLRNEKPYLAQGPISNKIIYSGYSCKQGWFFTPCMSDPSLRGLKNVVRMFIKKANCSEWEQVDIPSSVRSIVCLNLNNYASGRNPWGNLKPQYLEKRGFVEAHVDDGLLEIFGLKHGWHASFVMTELIPAKHIAQAAAIRFEFRGGEWKEGYLQMDGEPWKQPMDNEYSTYLDIKKVPFQSIMANGEP